MAYRLAHTEKGARPHMHKVPEIPPITSSLCGSLDLCESALSAIPFRFAHLNIRVLILFRISYFEFLLLYVFCFPLLALYTCRASSTNQPLFCKTKPISKWAI